MRSETKPRRLRLWHRLTGRQFVEDMVHDFRRAFPGRCMICSYHEHGINHFHIAQDAPYPEHHCIETGRWKP